MDLPVGQDSLVTITALYDAVDAEYVNDGTVKVSIETIAGTRVTNANQISAAYTTDSDGEWKAVIPLSATTLRAIAYWVVLEITRDARTQTLRYQVDGAYVGISEA